MELRDYQIEAVEALREGIRSGRTRQILAAPTGSGKTEIAMAILQSAVAMGKRVAFIVDMLTLVDQTSRRFDAAGIEHGVFRYGGSRGLGFPVTIFSAQTLERRMREPEADLFIIDEAHIQRKFITKIIRETSKPTIGLTATPFSAGLANTYDGVVNVTSTDKLREAGWLVPLRVYEAREIDMSGAQTALGEWTATEVETRGKKIVGDVVSEWTKATYKHFGKPVSTIVFSANVAHGEELAASFNHAGFKFETISYRLKDVDERRARIERLRRGETDGLISVDALTRGFDMPSIKIMVDCRPLRKSLATHIQKLGRVMRPDDDKEFALVLDHAGNWSGFEYETADFFAHGCRSLAEGGELQKTVRQDRPKTEKRGCIKCGLVPPPDTQVCPDCGTPRPVRQSGVDVAPGEMRRAKKAALPSDPWGSISSLAILKHPTDPVRAKRWAQAQMKSIVGRFARRDLQPLPEGKEPDERVVAAVETSRREWLRQKYARDYRSAQAQPTA